MTLDDIEAIPKEFLTAADVAPYLKGDPNSIRAQVREKPGLLGFPVTVIKSHVKINKRLFVQYYRGQLEVAV